MSPKENDKPKLSGRGGAGRNQGRKKKDTVKIPLISQTIAALVAADPRSKLVERILSLMEYAEKADRKFESLLVWRVVERLEGLAAKMEPEGGGAGKGDGALYGKRLYLPEWRQEVVERLEKETVQ